MKRILLVVTCSLLIGISCSKEKPALPVSGPTITDATGTAIPLNPPPARIISLAPSITHDIYLLGGQDKLVGVTKFCKLPPGESKPIISDLLNPNQEQIILLKPDLIIATKEGNDQESINKLRGIGLRVFVLAEATSWAEIRQQFQQTAILLDKAMDADRLLVNYDTELEQLDNFVKVLKTPTPPKVFIQMSDQFHTVTKNTFLDEAITRAGAINIAHNALGRWPMLSIEQIIIANPDLIMLTAMGTSTETTKAAWQKFPTLKAIRNNKIIVVDDDITCQPTPDHFVSIVKKIIGLTLQ